MSAYPDDGELTLEVGGAKISGWQSIRLTRGVERCPSDFDIAVTEKFPGSAQEVDVLPGQVCRVRIGKDLVLTGYVDRYLPSIVATGHQVRIMGRSACEDIVDCSIHRERRTFAQATLAAIATALCAPYGVAVRSLAGDGPVIPLLVPNLGETPYQAIERLARYGAMLVYDDVEGSLVLAQVGKEAMASGFRQGLNVLEATTEYTLDQRYSEYHAYRLSADSYGDFKPGSPEAAYIGSAAMDAREPPKDGNEIAVFLDEGMQGLLRPDGGKRIRELAIISEQTDSLRTSRSSARSGKWRGVPDGHRPCGSQPIAGATTRESSGSRTTGRRSTFRRARFLVSSGS